MVKANGQKYIIFNCLSSFLKKNIFGCTFASKFKQKIMKKLILVGLGITLVWLASCSSPESKLIGTWKVNDVETNFDEQSVSPEMLKQVIEMQKQTYFRIMDDSTMIIISNDNTHEARWILDSDDNTVTFFFEGMETTLNTLGKYSDDQIVSETCTPLGKMIIFYGKE